MTQMIIIIAIALFLAIGIIVSSTRRAGVSKSTDARGAKYRYSTPARWTEQKKLESKGHEYLTRKEYKLAERCLLDALNSKEINPIDRHFVYNSLIGLYYKLRDERKDALAKCVYYCREDISTLTEFLDSWKKQYPEDINLPQCPSAIQLAIIYEKSEQIKEAIDLCKYAIGLGLQDGTKKGFIGRLERLEKKANTVVPK